IPRSHTQEFDHYRLMADIRVYYLSCLDIESRADSASSIREFRGYTPRIKTLMKTEPALDEAFRRLNGQTLYPAAIRKENAIRVYHTHQLYQRLALSRF
ncbi:MAG TPA: hypothetical protein VHI52_05320, partial [Verrucomicrobiae bacterium]|nr:hypothetical protein [Verrucomicrobiae bacterium]